MTTGSNKIDQRLKAEGGEEKELTTGIPVDGFADPTGEYPRRDNWFASNVSAAGRGIKVNEVWSSGSVLGSNFDIPFPQTSIFPFNNANETPSGHSFEMDDTPGNERILIKHHTGAGVELKQDGSVLLSSRSHQVQVIGADHELVVSGEGNLTYDGDLNLTVNGNYNLTVGGSYNVDVGANQNVSVRGSYIKEVGDAYSTIVRGNMDERVWGDTFTFTASEHKLVAKKDMRILAGNDMVTNVARGFRVTAEKHITTSCGGFTTFSSEDMRVIGRKGKIGGPDFHHFGSLFAGGEDAQGKETVFYGNLVGRALEAWTAKYAKFSEHASSAHYSNLVAFEIPFNAMASVPGVGIVVSLPDTMDNLEVGGSVQVVCSPDEAMNDTFTPIPANNPPNSETATSMVLVGASPSGLAAITDGNTKLIDTSGGQDVKAAAKPSDIILSPMCETPDYQFDWGWKAHENRADQQTSRIWSTSGDEMIDPDEEQFLTEWPDADVDHEVQHDYIGNPVKWWEVWNKLSPYAVRIVRIDDDDVLEDKIAKIDTYTNYFNWTPTTAECRAKLRTMDGANDGATTRSGELDAEKCIKNLLNENRISPLWEVPAPPAPYEVKRTGQSEPKPRFGYTLMGNPMERASKTFTPKNMGATSRTIVADPVYNPDKNDAPITSGTRLSKSSTVSKFLGAAGSKSSLEYIPLIKDRQDLARQWYLHAWLMEGVANCHEFRNHRLQVTEGYYNPANGIWEQFNGKTEPTPDNYYWREPYRKEDGGDTQKSIVTGTYPINQLKYEGRAVVYTLYNSRGKQDYSATFDLSLYIRDTFFFDQLSLDYDMTRPDKVMSQQLIVVMPKIKKDFKADFQQKVCTYFNRKMFSGNDLVEITD